MVKKGKPYKFTPRRQKKFLELIKKGVRRHKAAEAIGMHPTSILAHIQKHPDFADALDIAEAGLDDEVENALFETAKGGHHQAQQFWLMNRRPEEWQDRRFAVANKTTITSLHDNVKIEQSIQNADPEDIMELLKVIRNIEKGETVIETTAEPKRIDVDEELTRDEG